MKDLFLFIGLFLFSVVFANAQISHGGTPPSFIYQKEISNSIDERNLPAIDVNKVLQEDSTRPGPMWAGKSIPVGLNMDNSGTWTDLPDGSRIWRLKLKSSGAKAISVCYDDFFIPEGGKLFLYNEAKTQVIGAYSSENNPVKRLFSTEMIQGESVTLEYVSTSKFSKKQALLDQLNGAINENKINTNKNISLNATKPSITISEIVYVYRDVPFLTQYASTKTTGWGTSLSCEVNVNCSEGTSWQIEKRGVAEIFLKVGSMWGWCSGTLINTTNNSGTPYFLTAGHCYSEGGSTASTADMLQWQFYFKYEASSCTTPSSEPSHSSLIGCALKSTSPINGGSDFCLVLLNSTPPQSYNPYYNGWDRTNTAATSGVGIHHPCGDIKKISTFTASLLSNTWNDGTNVGITNAHWSGNWVSTTHGYGQVEPGSSGSSLFNQNHKVVGTLSGATAANCTSGSYFNYGKFYYHWDLGGSSNSQKLKPWLDPTGTNATTVNGYDPSTSSTPTAAFTWTPTSPVVNTSVQFTDQSTGATPITYAWTFGDGGTSTSQNPTHTYTTTGAKNVCLTATNSLGNNQICHSVTVVTSPPAGCNTLSPPTASLPCGDTLTYYKYQGTIGYVTGNNTYGDLELAQKFYNTTSGTIDTVTIAVKAIKKPTASNTYVKIYSVDPTTKAPSTLLGTSIAVALSTISTTAGTYQDYVFATPVAVNGNFYASLVLPTGTGDTLVVYSTKLTCSSADSLSWEYDGNWWAYKTTFTSSNYNFDLAVYPVLCTTIVGEDNLIYDKDVLVFPNPASNSFTIDFSGNQQKDVTVKVYNMIGKLVKTVSANDLTDKLFIDMANESNGVYFLNIKTPQGTIIKKLSLIK
jgi:PKD repeat protein